MKASEQPQGALRQRNADRCEISHAGPISAPLIFHIKPARLRPGRPNNRGNHMAVDKSDELLTQLTTSIVSAYVTKNRVPQTQLAAVIESVAQSISKLGTEAAPIIDTPTPAVPIRKSVTHEFLISLEDGKQLNRHSLASVLPQTLTERNGGCQRITRWLQPAFLKSGRLWRSKWLRVSAQKASSREMPSQRRKSGPDQARWDRPNRLDKRLRMQRPASRISSRSSWYP